MRQVGHQHHLAEGLGAVGRAFDRELAARVLDVGLVGLQQVRGDLLALLDQLLRALQDRRAADRQRAAAVGAQAELDQSRIAMDDLHILEGHAQLVRDDLSEGGLVALALALDPVRAGENRHFAGGMHPHDARLPPAGAGAHLAKRLRGRASAGFDVTDQADAQVAPLLASFSLLLAPARVAELLERLVQVILVVSAVVHRAGDDCMRE